MVKKKTTPKKNLQSNALQIFAESVESVERELIQRENSSVICLEVTNERERRRRAGGGRRHVCEA